MADRYEVKECPCCAAEFLIDYVGRNVEYLAPASKSADAILFEDDEVLFDDEDPTHELDLDGDLEEPEITAEPEPGSGERKYSTHPDYRCNTNYRESYESGAPRVPGKATEDGTAIKNKPVSRYNSGITVETQMRRSASNSSGMVRQQPKKASMQPAAEMKGVFAPPKKKPQQMTDADISREGFEVDGATASQDFTGLTGQEAHFDNLMQAAYEADLAARGF